LSSRWAPVSQSRQTNTFVATQWVDILGVFFIIHKRSFALTYCWRCAWLSLTQRTWKASL
jgi:hypothetical protein